MTKKLRNGGEKDNGVSCESYISFLPAAILLEMFLRLPVTVILNCKLVCKAWYKVISDSSFSINYMRNPPFTQFLLPVDDLRMIHFLEVSNNGNCIHTTFNAKLPRDWLGANSYLIDSCNGLLLLRISKPKVQIICVCNPITGEYIALPPRQGCHDKIVTYKFGFIPATSIFKVIRITYRHIPYYWVEACDILTVGVDDRWRRLAIPFIDSFFLSSGVSLNGALHFIQVKDEATYISTFDFAEEKTGQIISHPPDVVIGRNTKLKIFGNQLSIVDTSVKSRFTIWRMKEYGNVMSWTKDVIQKRWFPSAGVRSRIFEPIGGLQNGDILIARAGHLFSCNVKQKKGSEIELFDSQRELTSMTPYTPRFSSLNEFTMKGNEEA